MRLRKSSTSESGLGSPTAVCRIRTTSSGSNDSEPIAPEAAEANNESEDFVPQVAKVIVVDPQKTNTEVS